MSTQPPGKGDTRESAVIAEYGNGLITLAPLFRSFRIYEGKDYPVLPAVSGEGASTLEITLRDTVLPIDIILRYSAYEEEDAIVRSAEIRNGMDEPLLLRSFASAMLDLPDAGWDIMTFDGTWGRERKENRRRFVPGVSYVDSKLGASSNEHNPLVILLRPETDDRHGEAIAVNMVYSGNHMEKAEVSPYGLCRLIASINPYGFCWKLDKGCSFRSPEAVISYSASGLDDLSYALHRFTERRIERSRAVYSDRPIAINSWEAAYFDISEEKLLALILDYDRLCREAIGKGADVAKLFVIPAREKIGRAKSVPEETYAAEYEQIRTEMTQEIAAVAAQGGEQG